MLWSFGFPVFNFNFQFQLFYVDALTAFDHANKVLVCNKIYSLVNNCDFKANVTKIG